jgi:2-keto-4-pentenoate hydratase/2-oxohepta-3-ene-1,7-dioic acid hydratase in catechol pathway
MRFVRYRTAGGTRHGIVEDDRVAEIDDDPLGRWSRTGAVHPWGDVVLDVPLVPRTFFAAGQNYLVHATHYPGGRSDAPQAVPATPAIGYRAPGSLVGHGAPIRIPHDATEKVHYEGELVVVIGKAGKRIPRTAALDHVFGYSIGNDVSERSWQKADRTPWRAKNADSFNTIGPWIETDFDLAAAETIVRLNGREETRFKTAEMLFGIEDFISTISEYTTLQPGDMIWMGTEGSSPDMKAGDVVEVEITGIGVLRNPVTRDASPG